MITHGGLVWMLGVVTGIDAVLQKEARLSPAPILWSGSLISLLRWDTEVHIVYVLLLLSLCSLAIRGAIDCLIHLCFGKMRDPVL